MERILTTLHTLGEHMLDAIENNDLPTFYELLNDREALIDELASLENDSISTSEIQNTVDSLSAQYAYILNALRVRREHMQQTLHDIELLKKANQSYHESTTSRRKILSSDLRG